jgi:hypothetical protein
MTGSVTVTINPLPVVTVSPNITICGGTSTTLTASGADTYTWSPTTYLSPTTGPTVTATPVSTITYTVTGTITATRCTNTASVTVTVTPAPYMLAVQESFNSMTTGNLGSQNGWVPFQDGAGNNDIQIANLRPLTFPGYGSCGNYDSVYSGRDPYKPFYAPISTSANLSIWTSFIVNTEDAAHFSGNTTPSVVLKNISNPTNYLSCLSIGSNNANLYYGISRGGDNIVWSAARVRDVTYLIVLRYDIRPSGTDTMYMWIDPPLTSQPLTSNAEAMATVGTQANYGTEVSALELLQGVGAGTPPKPGLMISRLQRAGRI